MMKRSRLVLITIAAAVALLTPLLSFQLGLWHAITPGTSESDGDANKPPTARFTMRPESPRALETVLFDARGSFDPDGGVALFTWDFGDETTFTVNQPEVLHFFRAVGDLIVNLTVTDDRGANGSAAKMVTVWWDPARLHREKMSISINLSGPGLSSVWVPLLLGSPFEDPIVWRTEGVEISLVEESGRTFMNVTSSETTDNTVVVEFEESATNESYRQYAWSAQEARAFSNQSLTVVIHYFAINGLPPPWQDAGSWHGCFREDTLTGVLSGDGSWTSLEVETITLCS